MWDVIAYASAISPEVWAAWVQAIGSVGAIAAAIWIDQGSARRAEAGRREASDEEVRYVRSLARETIGRARGFARAAAARDEHALKALIDENSQPLPIALDQIVPSQAKTWQCLKATRLLSFHLRAIETEGMRAWSVLVGGGNGADPQAHVEAIERELRKAELQFAIIERGPQATRRTAS